MEPFRTLTAPLARLDRANVDTDQIIPGRFLRTPRDQGYGRFLFADLDLDLDPAARVLVAGANFGCGSSRESAVWALVDRGFRAVIAPSFGDIFFNNACRNGLLPVRLEAEACAALGEGEVHLDLPAQTVTPPGGAPIPFDLDPFRKHCLLEGLDDVALTLTHADALDRFEARHALPGVSPGRDRPR